MPASIKTTCCIAGGGPAGMMLGYLLARGGVQTVVLEKHQDFLRDFRGDTVHPSTLEVMHELGLLDALLKVPHQKLERISGWFGPNKIDIADFTNLKVRCPYIAFMPQWDFLNFLAAEGRRFPHLQVFMKAEAMELIREQGRVVGVRAQTEQGMTEIRADLTVAADGRHSRLRELAGLELHDRGAPIDVLWFRVKRDSSRFDQTFTHVGEGKIMITLDRGDYWQCAYVIPKGGAEQTRQRGLEAFRADIASIAEELAPHMHEIESWDDVKLLEVKVNRLEQWSMPGFLCIGDAAHAMSPVGGVGVNLAVQDAVATANLLGEALRQGRLTDDDLLKVQHRRLFPTRTTQAFQVAVQNRILDPVLSGSNAELEPPLPLRLLSRHRWLRGMAARAVGMGVRPEHVLWPAGLNPR
ncbi:FAD-dependent oxidoreductase [Dyella sp. GSA-30]|uniref:FAD-dependent oxidoreductase n=1 Tax=Dyella sp. GSA-30 TaxID=2994496 RepID=UPI0024928D7A|nr:FAD-dependent oxidoreductase [Dyella sp. GSA-30]